AAFTGAWNVAFEVEQCRMIRRDAAVDDADDHVLAAQTEVRAQAADRIFETEEHCAVVRLKLLIGVEPDALDVVPLSETGRLPRCEPCGEAVHRVTKTIELAAGRADFPEQPIVGLLEVLHVALDGR